jgi:hypothetical protein
LTLNIDHLPLNIDTLAPYAASHRQANVRASERNMIERREHQQLRPPRVDPVAVLREE